MHHQSSRGRNSRSNYHNYDSSAQRRSRSSQPYHAVSETYSKEVTHKPVGPISNFPPEVVDHLRQRSTSPPLVRSRENTWTNENFPIVRVPSAQFTDIMTELYDYHEVEKFTRRSESPDYAILKRREPKNEFLEVEKEPSIAPTYNVIPPTPEKHTPRQFPSSGIPLTASESLEDIVRRSQKKPLPMYEEYLKKRESSEEKFKNLNLRHIDSSSSETSEVPRGEAPKRHVYSHDVYVDSATGRPFTPGRPDLDKENCGKLKINVYFKPPHPPVTPIYTLDEIEIEKTCENSHVRLRPSRSASSIRSRPISHFSSDTDKSTDKTPTPSRFPIRTSILRKEHEILEIPLSKRPIAFQPPSEIDLDLIFPKMQAKGDYPRQPPHPVQNTLVPVLTLVDQGANQYQTQVPSEEKSKSSTPVLPYTRGISKTPSDQEKRSHHHPRSPTSEKAPSVYDRNSKTSSNLPIYMSHTDKDRFDRERTGSFISTTPSHKSDKPNAEIIIPVHIVETSEEKRQESREKSILPLYENRKPKRQSPEELDYGKFEKTQKHFPAGHPRENPTPELPLQRGVSKTPNGHEVRYRPERNSKTSRNTPIYVHQPGNVDKERYQKSTPSERSSYRTHSRATVPPKTNQYQTQVPSEEKSKSSTPVLPYTRGISKTPSDQEKRSHHHPRSPTSEKAPSVYDRTASPRSRGREQPRPGHTQSPYEEVVHIKERYERDETIRRFFPTTTTV